MSFGFCGQQSSPLKSRSPVFVKEGRADGEEGGDEDGGRHAEGGIGRKDENEKETIFLYKMCC